VSFASVEAISRTLLYEGLLLYPYRPSAWKNQQRPLLGRLLPRAFSQVQGGWEPWKLRTECLYAGPAQSQLVVQIRFLQWPHRRDPAVRTAWPDVVQRHVTVDTALWPLTASPLRRAFACESQLNGAVTLAAEPLNDELFKLSATVENLTPVVAEMDLEQVLDSSPLATQALLCAKPGNFVSLLDPPESCRAAAATCRNEGLWPVLAGPEPGRIMLAAPMILYDYPQLAAESPGDLCDGTEIDELLSLRIRTLSSEERQEIRAAGDIPRDILERTESLTNEQLLNLHGTLRTITNRRPAAADGPAAAALMPRPPEKGPEPISAPGTASVCAPTGVPTL
jgi:hypothetical protein